MVISQSQKGSMSNTVWKTLP